MLLTYTRTNNPNSDTKWTVVEESLGFRVKTETSLDGVWTETIFPNPLFCPKQEGAVRFMHHRVVEWSQDREYA